MVRTYKRQSGRQQWSKTAMEAAIDSVRRSGTSIKRAAKDHGIPRPTLIRYLKTAEVLGQEVKQIGSFKTVFTPAEEAVLMAHILDFEVRCYGITTRDIRSLAFQLAERNGKAHVFNTKTQLAGWDWLHGFRKRHPKLSLRTPEATSAARLQAFNKIAVDNFFDVLHREMDGGKFSASRIFNVDETSVLTVQTKRSKVFALKGRRQVGAVTSAERGLLSTASICMSATGQILPPMMIFPRARLTTSLMEGAPPDTVFVCNSSGWMTVKEFNTWFEHFLKHTRPTADNPVLLILDGHSSHTKNLGFIERARECHVTVVCLPPHCSHKLQPLDISYMGPLKTAFSKEVESFLKCNPGRVVTLNEISRLFGSAFMKTSNAALGVNGFRKAGIFPLNRFIFNDNDFAPADVTDVLPADPETDRSNNELGDEALESNAADTEAGPSRMHNEVGDINDSLSNEKENIAPKGIVKVDANNMLTPKATLAPLDSNVPAGLSVRSIFKVSPAEILPLPKTVTRKVGGGRKREKARNITSSPSRNELKSSQALKDIDQLKKVIKAETRHISNSDAETPKRKRGRPKGKSNQTKTVLAQDTLCEVCGCCFSSSDKGQDWIKCSKCCLWFHECQDSRCPSCAFQ